MAARRGGHLPGGAYKNYSLAYENIMKARINMRLCTMAPHSNRRPSIGSLFLYQLFHIDIYFSFCQRVRLFHPPLQPSHY